MPEAKILVIDDERMIGWSIMQTLGAAGYEVVTAETAAEAMRLGACEYLKKPFDFAEIETLTRRALVTA